MHSNKNFISYFFLTILIFEFMIFFHIDIGGVQIKLVRFLQALFIIYFIYFFFFDFRKENFSKIIYCKIDLFFTIFITYLFLNAFFYFFINNDLLILKLSFFEILKFIFYYFVYLYLIRFFYKEINLFLLHKLLYFFLYFIIVLGLTEFIYNYFLSYNFIPRQFNYGINDANIGLRFHSILGEPRDAAVNLLKIFSLIIFLELLLYKKLKSYLILFLTLLSAILTMSTTLVFTIVIIIIFYLVINKNYINSILILFIGYLILFIVFNLDQRVLGYISDFFLLPIVLNDINDLKNLNLEPQLINIIPIYLFIMDLINLNLIEFVFGHGVKSSSFISYLAFENIGDNPHSQLSRLVYDVGLVGLLTYIYLLNYYKELILKMNMHNKNMILISFIIFLSASLAHRTGTFFIFLSLTHLVYIKSIHDLSN